MPIPGRKLIADLLEQFPDAPALTLAKKLYAANPEVWSSVEACRGEVRTMLGVSGKRDKNKVADKRFFREPRKPGNWLGSVPEPLRHFDFWGAVGFAGPMKALILSDIHFPYYDSAALTAAINHGVDQKANHVFLNGDIFDFYGLSQWETDPRKRDFPAEVRGGRELLGAIRSAFPRAKIVFKEGNHEERYERYLRLKAPDLLGLPEFSWQEVYGLDRNKIQHVGEKRPMRLSKLNVIHGHEYRFAISNPVNPARGLFLRAKTNALCGHFHQRSNHDDSTLDEKGIATYSTGCLCNLKPDYRPLNNWGHGFAFVDITSTGAFHVDNRKIVKGAVR